MGCRQAEQAQDPVADEGSDRTASFGDLLSDEAVDGSGDGYTWYADSSSDPAGCANTDPAAPLAGNWAAADSDCAGSGVAMDVLRGFVLLGILVMNIQSFAMPVSADVNPTAYGDLTGANLTRAVFDQVTITVVRETLRQPLRQTQPHIHLA